MNEAANHHGEVSFEEWVDYCFGQGPRDFAGEGLTPDEPDEVSVERCVRFAIDEKTSARYLKRLFLESGSLLSNVSDANLVAGAWYVFGVGGSFFDHMTSAYTKNDGTRSPVASTSEIAAVFEAMPTMYRDVFNRRCPTEFNPEGKASSDADRLGTAVHMIWDMSSGCSYLISKGESANPDKPIPAAGLKALSTVLRECDSPACLFSALHGLGHLVRHGQSNDGNGRRLMDRGQSIIDSFLKFRSRDLPESMVNYARRARDGAIR